MRAVLVSYDASFQLAGFTKLGAGTVACDREYNIYNEDAMTGPMCRTIGGRGDVIGMAFGAVGEASSSVLVHAKACAEAISKEAMSDGDVDAVTKDTGYGRVLRRLECRPWQLYFPGPRLE